MAQVVYVLCALMSLACAVLLLRAWSERRVKLLFWSGLCFVGFAMGNAMLVVDKLVTGPNTDLILFRTLPILFGLGVLLYGMIWGTR
jgi:drug/metabolite transporter (DMT)-like permease